jgi:nucleotide-binding universal stress UspA family protein
MSFKEILVCADANKVAESCLDTACKLATKFDAHLVALHVLPLPVIPIDAFGAVPVELIEWQQEYSRKQSDAAKREVDLAAQRNGCPIEWRAVEGDIAETALLHSRYADLVVLGQTGAEVSTGLAESVLMGSGRPVLMVPHDGKVRSVGERVLIAWNRSREATRAVHDALPLLTGAKKVTVMEVDPSRGRDRHFPGADIVRHLTRHGVNAEASATTADGIGAANAILSRAADLDIDCLVMGGYGHSRLGELVFGGVTRTIMDSMTIPTLMSH